MPGGARDDVRRRRPEATLECHQAAPQLLEEDNPRRAPAGRIRSIQQVAKCGVV